MARLLSFLFLILLNAQVSLCAAVEGGDKTSIEADEMGALANLVQSYIDKTGHLPNNWNDIWNSDRILFLKIKNPNQSPVYERYSFVANNYPMVQQYDGSEVEGTILLMHNDVIDLSTEPQITWRAGREWWFVWVTSKHRARYAFLREALLSIGVGPGKMELKKPDLTKSTLEAFEKTLNDAGYTTRGVIPLSVPSQQSPSSSTTSLRLSNPFVSTQAMSQQVQPTGYTGFSPWYYAVIVFVLAGLWHFLRTRK